MNLQTLCNGYFRAGLCPSQAASLCCVPYPQSKNSYYNVPHTKYSIITPKTSFRIDIQNRKVCIVLKITSSVSTLKKSMFLSIFSQNLTKIIYISVRITNVVTAKAKKK